MRALGGGGADEGHHSIFDAQGYMSMSKLMLCMIALIVIIAFIELGEEHLEHAMARHEHATAMMTKINKELMIMGIISFCLLIVLQTVPDLPTDYLMMFELAHVWLFVAALIYVAHAWVFMNIVRTMKGQWDTAGKKTPEQLLAEPVLAGIGRRRLHPRLRFLRWCIGRGRNISQMEFFLLRHHVVSSNHLPRSFDFAKYLRHALTRCITDQMEIKVITWCSLVVLIAFYVLVLTFDPPDHNEYGGDRVSTTTTTILGWCVLVADFTLLILTRRSKDILLRHAGCPSMEELPAMVELKARFQNPIDVGSCKVLRVFRARRRASVGDGGVQGSANGQRRRRRWTRAYGEYADVFPLQRPWIFTRMLDLIMLLQCFTLGLVVLVTIKETFAHNGWGTAVVLISLDLLPQMIVMFWCSPRVLRNFVLIEAASLSAVT